MEKTKNPVYAIFCINEYEPNVLIEIKKTEQEAKQFIKALGSSKHKYIIKNQSF